MSHPISVDNCLSTTGYLTLLNKAKNKSIVCVYSGDAATSPHHIKNLQGSPRLSSSGKTMYNGQKSACCGSMPLLLHLLYNTKGTIHITHPTKSFYNVIVEYYIRFQTIFGNIFKNGECIGPIFQLHESTDQHRVGFQVMLYANRFHHSANLQRFRNFSYLKRKKINRCKLLKNHLSNQITLIFIGMIYIYDKNFESSICKRPKFAWKPGSNCWNRSMNWIT